MGNGRIYWNLNNFIFGPIVKFIPLANFQTPSNLGSYQNMIQNASQDKSVYGILVQELKEGDTALSIAILKFKLRQQGLDFRSFIFGIISIPIPQRILNLGDLTRAN